jgi:hypothetical protein
LSQPYHILLSFLAVSFKLSVLSFPELNIFNKVRVIEREVKQKGCPGTEGPALRLKIKAFEKKVA